jgi:hypothetical protein
VTSWSRIVVAVETDDLPVRAGNGGARGDRDALPDRATDQRKMIDGSILTALRRK